MLGSHNSMTYLPVKQWYFKPLFWTARCQSKPLYEQYELGARLFDIRVRFDENGYTVLAHGLIEFEGDVYDALKELNSLASKHKIYVRISLESNSRMKDQYMQEYCFKDFCSYIQRIYTNLIFFGGRRKYDWAPVYDFGTAEPTIEDSYSSTTNIFGESSFTFAAKLDDLWPWLYAKIHNKKRIKMGTDKQVLLIDFVNIQ